MNSKWTKCLCFMGVTLLSFVSLKAQQAPPTATEATEEKKDTPLSITGQVDAYYRFSASDAPGLTSYTPGYNSFNLGMANLAISKDMGKISFVADMIFGPRAEGTNYLYTGNSLAFIKQLYVAYKPTDKVKFTLGNFMTYFGYELVEASNNLNYSMSYNYTNGPFFHTGMKADFTLSDNLTAMVGVFNPTDTKSFDGRPNIGGQLAYVNGGFKAYFNVISGKGTDSFATKAAIIDLVASYQVTPKFGLGLNLTNKGAKQTEITKTDNASWQGYILYANYAATDKFTLAARGEYFNDSKGVALLNDKITAFTLSGIFKVDALSIIPEVRFDKGSTALWNGKKSDTSLILAAVYKF
jgi:hypothetical protein